MLKGDALLAEQDPQALVADVIDHPAPKARTWPFRSNSVPPAKVNSRLAEHQRGGLKARPVSGQGGDNGRLSSRMHGIEALQDLEDYAHRLPSPAPYL